MNPCRAIVISNIRHSTIFLLIVTYLKIKWSVDEDLITYQQKMYTAREICQHNLYTSNINEKESYIQYCIILCNICNIGNFIMQYFQYLVQKVAFRTKKKICHTCPLSKGPKRPDLQNSLEGGHEFLNLETAGSCQECFQ